MSKEQSQVQGPMSNVGNESEQDPTLDFGQGTLDSRNRTVECLGMTFESDEARRAYFLEKLRERLRDPEFRKIEGFPIGSDEDILALSDPPYYTACPNPWPPKTRPAHRLGGNQVVRTQHSLAARTKERAWTHQCRNSRHHALRASTSQRAHGRAGLGRSVQLGRARQVRGVITLASQGLNGRANCAFHYLFYLRLEGHTNLPGRSREDVTHVNG